MSLSHGEKVGPYEILSPLGAGGMGEVYRARDTRLERTMAIKILPAHLSCDPVVKQRFERGSQGNFRSESSPHLRVARHRSARRDRLLGHGVRRGRDAGEAAGERAAAVGAGGEIRGAGGRRAGQGASKAYTCFLRNQRAKSVIGATESKSSFMKEQTDDTDSGHHTVHLCRGY